MPFLNTLVTAGSELDSAAPVGRRLHKPRDLMDPASYAAALEIVRGY
jgi:hypothetical protein